LESCKQQTITNNSENQPCQWAQFMIAPTQRINLVVRQQSRSGSQGRGRHAGTDESFTVDLREGTVARATDRVSGTTDGSDVAVKPNVTTHFGVKRVVATEAEGAATGTQDFSLSNFDVVHVLDKHWNNL
jgi:hypothetical protein